MAAKVINIGSANIDEIMSVVHFPLMGETKYTMNFCKKLGGKGANQAVAAARAGGHCVFLGSVGMDANGGIIRNKLSDNGVDIKHLLCMEGQETGIAQVWTNSEEKNMIICFPGASLGNEERQLQKLEEIAGDGDVFMITLEYDKAFITSAIRIAREKGCMVVVDPSGDLDILKDKWIAGHVDIIKPNEVEAKQLTGIGVTDQESVMEALEVLEYMGFKKPIISLGARGCCARIHGKITFFGTDKIKAVDTTGAGDAFLGYLAAMLSKGETLAAALKTANKAAAISTTKLGAAESVPYINEICRQGIK